MDYSCWTIPVPYRGPCAEARYARLDGAGAADKGLNLRRRPANVVQALVDPQGNADLLEGDTKDTHRFMIKSVAV
jgi:hypothetical protein